MAENTIPNTFKAFRVEEQGEEFKRSIETMSLDDLPAGEVTVQVAYSSLNYKDALSATGNRGVTKNFPHTPGIDAAGKVISSEDSAFNEGDEVVVTSYDLGMNTPGGFGEVIRVPAEWVVPLPEGLSLAEAMALGTAGFTAALCVDALEQQGFQDGPVIVTGASGGVGSVAVALLAKAGREVVASTGSESAHEMLKKLGASRIVPRDELSETSERPMNKGVYGGAVDTVGGATLVNLVKQLKPHASVAACGLVGGVDLELTVYPFILRGVNLLGIDSQTCPMPKRKRVWEKLGGEWNLELSEITKEIGLGELDTQIDAILKGETQGRVRVKVAG